MHSTIYSYPACQDVRIIEVLLYQKYYSIRHNQTLMVLLLTTFLYTKKHRLTPGGKLSKKVNAPNYDFWTSDLKVRNVAATNVTHIVLTVDLSPHRNQ